MVDQKTKITIEIVDKKTGEPIPGMTVQIVDQKTGEVIYEYETDEEPKEIEGLPIGDYKIISKDEKNIGYEQAEEEIKIKDAQEKQEFKIENEKKKAIFSVEKTLSNISLNGENIQITDPKLSKLEIKTSEVKNTNLIAEYNIKVTNKGEVEGKVKVIEEIPEGFEIIEGLEEWTPRIDGTLEREEELEAGQSKDIKISLRWVNTENNLGTKTNKAGLEGDEDSIIEDNTSEATVIVSLKTGEIVSAIIIIMIVASLAICGYVIAIVISKMGRELNRIRFL